MYRDKKIIAIMPARSGSKGVKDKNIKELCGKPLIAYTIEAAQRSNVFDCIFVSTDSEKYAQIAKQYGAEVPFLRSAENSSDKSGTWDVVREVLAKLDEKFDIVILLQPTSPLRMEKDIINALDLFFTKNADKVVSVCETDHPAFWCNTLDETLSMKDFVKKEYNLPRQALPKTYTLNGAVYICKAELLSRNISFYDDKSYAYIMSKEASIDIDSELDFKIAELCYNERVKNKRM